MTSDHAAELERLGAPSSRIPALAAYLDSVARWSPRINLTGARSPRERARTLVADALAAAPWVEPPSLVDVGSGAGSPGLVLALLEPALQVTLLEPRHKRWAFLREVCRQQGRPDVTVLDQRHDQWPGPPARTVTLRALRLPLGELGRCCAAGGRLIVIGVAAAEPPFEREAAQPGPIHVFRHTCST